MGYIYKISNDINDKVYIGQTKKTINYRFKEHIRQAQYEKEGNRPITYFHNAINKYGEEHFFVNQIEQCDNELLNEREIYWIKQYDSYNNGYNSTTGGQLKLKNNKTKKVIQYDLEGNFKAIFNSSEEAAKEVNVDVSYIRQACNPNTRNKSAAQYQWRYYTEDYPLQISKITGKSGRNKTKVKQYDLKGNYIRTFDSVTEAAEATNQTRRNISHACEKKQNKAGNYQWRYDTDLETPKNLIAEQLSKYCNPYTPIIQKDNQNNLVYEWPSIIDAAEQLHLDAKKIGLTCEQKQKTYNKYQWQYKI